METPSRLSALTPSARPQSQRLPLLLPLPLPQPLLLHTHHHVSDTATMIAQMSALRASLIAKRDALLAQVAEINEALGD